MSNTEESKRILVIYGNPKQGGLVHSCLDHIGARLTKKGFEIDALRLVEAQVDDCRGCFVCLRSGKCTIEDDVCVIIEKLRAADGLVVGASVRNGFFPAMYKRLYERLTYPCGFARDLHGKHVVAVGAVGMAGGRRALGRQLTFREFHTNVVDYLFFRAGIPSKLTVSDVEHKLNRAADKLVTAVRTDAPLGFINRLMSRIDDWVVRRFMLKRNPDGVYDYIVRVWREKGLL